MGQSNKVHVSFDDTAVAFAYKTDAELNRAKWLFTAMAVPRLVKWGTSFTPWAIRNHLPVKALLRNTIFEQFVGGETLQQTTAVVDRLASFEVDVILDYGVEGGEASEHAYDLACEEFIRVIQYASGNMHIPFMSVKMTGIAATALLEKLDSTHIHYDMSVFDRFEKAFNSLSENEQRQWQSVIDRLTRICDAALTAGVGVLIDAEESWLQDSVDVLTLQMMERYNKENAVVFNTYQLYRHDRLAFLRVCCDRAIDRDFVLGAKLVRGAYMEKERARAAQYQYPSPIHADKLSTDRDYDAAIRCCIDNMQSVTLMVASHNETSNELAATLLQEIHDDGAIAPEVYFSQLYGMSDHITFNLAKAGFAVSKYLPFGPLKDVVPYLMRRAEENSSVAGQTGRELSLIRMEVDRRKKASSN